MALSSDLVSQFVKATKDKVETPKESTAYGQIVIRDGKEYVQLDGSELFTPISTTTVVKDGDRVMVTIKNHTAIVTGDLTNPSASNKDVTEIGNKISEFEIIIADKVTTEQLEAEVARITKLVTDEFAATNAEIETLTGKVAEIDTIKADVVEVSGKVTANEAEIDTIKGDIADFKDVTAESIKAVEGNFNNLNSDYASFKETTTNKLSAAEADIKDLDTDKLDAETAKVTYATIDFSNIGEAAIEKLFSDSGIIKDLIMSDGKVTGELVGVTIKGDIIEGNTVKADKLVILGEDGLYYKLNVDALGETTASSDEKYQNGLDGSAILAESITAEKIAVDDLVAFGATIGGFHINNHAIYSGVKSSMTNTTPGMHMTDDGQINIGDQNNFFKYYIDENGQYKLEIQADNIKIGSSGTTIKEYIKEVETEKLVTIKEIEGTELVIPDGKKVIDFRIDGKSSQKTRTGYNLLSSIIVGTVNASFSNGVLTFDYTDNRDTYARLLFEKKEVGKTYTLVFDGAGLPDNESVRYYLEGNTTEYSFKNGKNVWVQTANTDDGQFVIDDSSRANIHSVITLSNIMILEGSYTEDNAPSYESYGVMPSPNYPSEIDSLGYENLLDLGTEVLGYTDLSSGLIVSRDDTRSYYFKTSDLPDIVTISSKNGNRSNVTYWNEEPTTSGQAVVYGYPNYMHSTRIIEIDKNYPYVMIQYSFQVIPEEIQITKGQDKHLYIPCGKTGIEIINESKNKLVLKDVSEATLYGITYSVSNQKLTINGTGTSGNYPWLIFTKYGFYTKNGTPTADNIMNWADGIISTGIVTRLVEIFGGSTTYSVGFNLYDENGNQVTSKLTDTTKVVAIGIYLGNGTKYTNHVVGLQLTEGTDVVEYEPGFRNSTVLVLDQPLRCIPNGAAKDVAYIQNGKVIVERNIKSVIYDGDENWYKYDGKEHTFALGLKEVFGRHGRGYCSHFKEKWSDKWGIEDGIWSTYTSALYISHLASSTLAEFKAWLAENPIIVECEIDNPITEEYEIPEIPMYEESTDIYYINDDLDPNIYCKYYTIYAGIDGENGKDGLDGEDGKSAYQIWLDAGNEGTEEDFLNSTRITNTTEGNELFIEDGVRVVEFRVEGKSIQEHYGKDLPTGYIDLDYIEATGDQYIDIGIKPAFTDNVYIETEIQWAESKTNNRQLFGANTGGHYWGKHTTGYYELASDKASTILASTDKFDHIEVTLDNATKTTTLTVDGVEAITRTYSSGSGYNYCVFNIGSSPVYDFYVKAKMKYYRVSINGGLVRNLIPCIRKSDSVRGMYDTVNGVFYSSATESGLARGTYAASPGIDHPSEIECIGYENLFDSEKWYEELHAINEDSMTKEVVDDIEYYKFKPHQIYLHKFMEGQFKENTQYTIRCKARKYDNTTNTSTGLSFAYTDGTYDNSFVQNTLTEYDCVVKSAAGKTVDYIFVSYNYNLPVLVRDIILIEGITLRPYVPFGKSGVEIIHRGKNLFNKATVTHGKTLSATGGVQSLADSVLSDYIRVRPNETYYLSHVRGGYYVRTCALYDKNKNFISIKGVSGQEDVSGTITTTENTMYIRVVTGTYYENCQVELGPKGTEIVPYTETSTVLELNEPLRAIGDVKDVAYVRNGNLYVDRRIGSKILTGDSSTEQWLTYTNALVKEGYVYYMIYSGWVRKYGSSMCTHFSNYNMAWDVGHIGTYSDHPEVYNKYFVSDKPTLTEFKAWLAENKPEIIYELETPVTDDLGPVQIPMHETEDDWYHTNEPLNPYLWCEYYTEYATQIANFENNVNNTTNILYQEIIDQRAYITTEAGRVVAEASKDLVKKVDYDKYVNETAIAQMRLEADGVFVDLNKENETRLGVLEEDNTTIKNNLEKHFSFTEDGLIIKSGPNSMKLQIDNEEGIIFTNANGDRVGYWDGNDFYAGNIIIRVEERAQFGNYAYIPKPDGSLMFTRVK